MEQLGKAAIMVVALGATLAGCDSGGDDRPRPPAPAIARPLDATAYAADAKVCGLLTDEDAKALGYGGAGVSSPSTAQKFSCRWNEPTALVISILNDDSFTALYSQGRHFVDELTLVGQPAVELAGDPAGRQSVYSHCRVLVALKAHQNLDVDVDFGPGGLGACDRAVRIATQVLHQLGA